MEDVKKEWMKEVKEKQELIKKWRTVGEKK